MPVCVLANADETNVLTEIITSTVRMSVSLKIKVLKLLNEKGLTVLPILVDEYNRFTTVYVAFSCCYLLPMYLKIV